MASCASLAAACTRACGTTDADTAGASPQGLGLPRSCAPVGVPLGRLLLCACGKACWLLSACGKACCTVHSQGRAAC